MKQIYAFHKTVQGARHIHEGLPCQDSSASFSDEGGRYHIAVVADGHGSPRCFRSAVGASVAVEIAMGNLKALAESVMADEQAKDAFCQELFSGAGNGQTAVRRLTDTIIAQWNDRVIGHFRENPPAREELPEAERGNFEKYLEKCWDDAGKPKIYGTTLMAALWTESFLLMLHQGDGRCVVFYEDGTVDQPVPWDEKCDANVTTSLCDRDAPERFRSCALDLCADKKPVACYLGCDGVEDSYRDTYLSLHGAHALMGGVHTFYKHLSCELTEKTPEQFQDYLEKALPELSLKGMFGPSGSGDDVSVAGIVDVEALRPYAHQFSVDIRRYVLEDSIITCEDNIRSMTRKHDYLRRRAAETEQAAEALRQALEKAAADKKAMEEKLQQVAEMEEQACQEMYEYAIEGGEVLEQAEAEAEDGILSRFMRVMGLNHDSVSDTLEEKKLKLERRYEALQEKRVACACALSRLVSTEKDKESELSQAQQEAEKFKTELAEYDARYKRYDEERTNLRAELNSLQDTQQA